MENLILNIIEYKILRKFKKSLEKNFEVEIQVPDVEKSASLTDVIFGSVYGSKENIENLKNFISERISERINTPPKNTVIQESTGIAVVTLSDSEEESDFNSSSGKVSTSEDSCSKKFLESSFENKPDCSTTNNESVCIIESTISPENSHCSTTNNESICIIESTISPKNIASCSTTKNESVSIIESTIKRKNLLQLEEENSPDDSICIIPSPNDSVCIIDSPSNSKNVPNKQWYLWDSITDGKSSRPQRRRRKPKVQQKQASSSAPDSAVVDVCEVTSTTGENELKRPSRICNESHGSIQVVLSNKPEPAPDFIALSDKRKYQHDPNERSKKLKPNPPMSEIEGKTNEDVIVLEPETVVPPPAPRRLRPIVIDGSNVARQHGKVSDTFSAKGIQLCVEYFLNRGHTQVTAFVPNFRRHGDRKKVCPTTDTPILEELANKQHVVFTPSRNLNGHCFASYDDRFIVQLASQNGGVIVSNDNFKDLLNESDSYKEAVTKRLLMYCFVGDVFMVPDDPLGRNGPTLSDYLSFPPDEESTT